MKRVIWAALISVCLSFVMSPTARTQDFVRENFALNNSALFPAGPLTLWNRVLLSNPMMLAWATPDDPLPSTDFGKNVSASPDSKKSLSDRLWNTPSISYATGEIGFMYGKSTGKYGGDAKQAYIIGETGNDKTQIFVGASYEDSSFRLPRSGR